MKLILFDADDTLYDFQESQGWAFSKLMSELGLESESAKIFESYKVVSRDLWSRLERGEVSREVIRDDRFRLPMQYLNRDFNFSEIGQRYLDLLSETQFLIPGAFELCQKLSQRTKIGIVTNGFRSVQQAKIKNSKLAPYIDFLVISEDVGVEKPHPMIFEEALGRAALTNREEVLMVGDNYFSDIKGAKDFGFKTCWFRNSRLKSTKPLNETKEFSYHDHLIETLSFDQKPFLEILK